MLKGVDVVLFDIQDVGARFYTYISTMSLVMEACAENKIPAKADSIAGLQYVTLNNAPYQFDGDGLLVHVTAQRRDVPKDEYSDLKTEIFSKGQPCLRASPLVKRLGWAVHHDADEKVGLVAVGSDRFEELLTDARITKHTGMRNKRA